MNLKEFLSSKQRNAWLDPISYSHGRIEVYVRKGHRIIPYPHHHPAVLVPTLDIANVTATPQRHGLFKLLLRDTLLVLQEIRMETARLSPRRLTWSNLAPRMLCVTEILNESLRSFLLRIGFVCLDPDNMMNPSYGLFQKDWDILTSDAAKLNFLIDLPERK